MQRRDFIRLSVTSLGAGIIAPQVTWAESTKPVTADVFYTKDAPGRWSSKVSTHLPNIEIIKDGGKITVKVITAHEMKGYEHYIVKHVLLDKNYQFINEHLFNPLEEQTPMSTFTLDNYSGTLYVLSLCNKHDLWLNSTEI